MKARIIKTDIAGIQLGSVGKIIQDGPGNGAAIKVSYTPHNGKTVDATYWFERNEYELILEPEEELMKTVTSTYPGGSIKLGEGEGELKLTHPVDAINHTVNIAHQAWVEATSLLQSLQNQLNTVNEILHGPQNS